MNKTNTILLATMILITGCQLQTNVQNLSASDIIERSQKRYDPKGVWGSSEIQIHIQEPRPQTPYRYSILFLDNATGEFKLTRTVEEGLVDRIVTPSGEAKVLLNGEEEISEDIIEKYRLGAERNAGFRSFYQTMYSLPMSLNSEIVENMKREEIALFEGNEVYVIRIILKESMISNDWLLYISKDYTLKALKFDQPDDSDRPDEIMRFDGAYTYDEITIPRFRHWYYEESKEYLGSDVIVKDIVEE